MCETSTIQPYFGSETVFCNWNQTYIVLAIRITSRRRENVFINNIIIWLQFFFDYIHTIAYTAQLQDLTPVCTKQNMHETKRKLSGKLKLLFERWTLYTIVHKAHHTLSIGVMYTRLFVDITMAIGSKEEEQRKTWTKLIHCQFENGKHCNFILCWPTEWNAVLTHSNGTRYALLSLLVFFFWFLAGAFEYKTGLISFANESGKTHSAAQPLCIVYQLKMSELNLHMCMRTKEMCYLFKFNSDTDTHENVPMTMNNSDYIDNGLSLQKASIAISITHESIERMVVSHLRSMELLFRLQIP